MGVAKQTKFGKGAAILMNLSPQWYNAYRVAGFDAAKKRSAFIAPIEAAAGGRWVSIKGAGPREHGYEISYWEKSGRTIVCLCMNPETSGSSTGGGNSVGLKTETIPITIQFAGRVAAVRNERSGEELG